MTFLSAAFIGSGQPLVRCAEVWLDRGNRVVGVVSDCPEVSAWARRRQIPRTARSEDVARALGLQPFEYLFSVINHHLTSPEVIQLASRGAINYHDSLLPAYAGFNAPAWSILDGNTTHGITWHRMTADADAGPVYLQVPIEIAPDDTAYTLEAKCSEAAVTAFRELVEHLADGSLTEQPQHGARSFHRLMDRPEAACVLDVRSGAEPLERMMRALSFGPQDNLLGVAKIWDGAGPIWLDGGRLAERTAAQDGEVLAVADGAVDVAVGGRRLELFGLSDVDGTALSAATLRARGLETGTTLPRPEPSVLAQVTELDGALRRSERFWVRRLLERHAPAFVPRRPPITADTRTRRVLLSDDASAALERVAAPDRMAYWAAALALLVRRLGDSDSFDLDIDLGLTPTSLSPFFSTRVPLRAIVDPAATFERLLDTVRAELDLIARHRGYARDVVVRYPDLRARLTSGALGPLPIAIAASSARRDLGGAILLLAVTDDARGAHFLFDAGGLDEGEASVLCERFEILLNSAWTEPRRAVAELPILSPRERSRLLTEWNATASPYDEDRCIHEFFEEQAARIPDRTAVVFGDAELTYAELNRRANRLARRLRSLGIGPEVLVGICIERSLEMMIGLLAILKAGGAYVPLDPAYPRERLSFMLDESRAPVLLTQRHLESRLDARNATPLYIDEIELSEGGGSGDDVDSGVTADNLAYVMFTSGSSGRPKGVMVAHRNVSNFFTGMDAVLGGRPGVWLAVTSISFDISVLELFWTLARGFEVVIHQESDRASLGARGGPRSRHPDRMGFGLFYFAADATNCRNAYRLLLEGAKFADRNGFDAVWTPERHFHAFGGLYPNPAITSAALATITTRVQLRAGSVVLPLHDPIRVAEEWSVVDNLSNGRVGLSFASGWHADDFAFRPENYPRRREVMQDYIDVVRRLWRGESVPAVNGEGKAIEVKTLPRPIQSDPPLWVASAGSVETFRAAGTMGVNVLTNMLGQDLADLRAKVSEYRTARTAAGHAGAGIVTVMLHTFIAPDTEVARRLVKEPFCRYLGTSLDLVKMAPWAFPAFRRPSTHSTADLSLAAGEFTPEDKQALLDHAFDRYFETAGLFGAPEKALRLIDQLKDIGVNEVACLVDFGVDDDVVLAHLGYLKQLMDASQPVATETAGTTGSDHSAARQMSRRAVTHLQSTPSMARMLASDPDAMAGLCALRFLLLGGEALPADVAEQMSAAVKGRVLNMYGPTETTIWSTAADVRRGEPVTIGRPLANTVARLLDAHGQLVPIGTPGLLYLGGAGITRGYLNRPDLTRERFLADPFAEEGRLYHTGDVVRYTEDGALQYLGRSDDQVKISGYRIELGEIESVLSRHPSVRQAVVTAHDDAAAGARLIAYVVPRDSTPDAPVESRVEQWQSLWNDAYGRLRVDGDLATPAATPDPRFDTTGWVSSVDGRPIAPEAMREWLDHTIDRILALKPRRVLEIGCGTGLLLYRLLPHVEHYTGVDFAPEALAKLRRELTAAESTKVTLIEAAADAVAPEQPVDLVIINSVAQYFPDGDYLERVIERVAAHVVDDGHIWVGDVRALGLQEALHASVALRQSADDAPASELRAHLERRLGQDTELVIDHRFFDALIARIPRLGDARSVLKRGRHRNELSRFRYDVVLKVGPMVPSVADVRPAVAPNNLADVRSLLESSPPILWLTGFVNARVSEEVASVRGIRAGRGTAAELLARLDGPAAGIDPEDLCALHPEYEVELRFAGSGVADRFDAVFRHKATDRGYAVIDQSAPVGGSQALTNRPARVAASDDRAVAWRRHVREHLPEYMVPSAFVVLTELPLTPNGKIDRRALPVPGAQSRREPEEYQAPASDLERLVAEVWERLLGVPRVGLDDNIFDLGANSLLTVQANSKLSESMGRTISLVRMFQYPTVRRLAAHLAEPDGTSDAGDAGRERAGRRMDAMERRRQARTKRGRE